MCQFGLKVKERNEFNTCNLSVKFPFFCKIVRIDCITGVIWGSYKGFTVCSLVPVLECSQWMVNTFMASTFILLWKCICGFEQEILVLVITCLREIWGKFTELTFLKFRNLNFPQISRINMLFLVNHKWQNLKEHTRIRITQKQPVSTDLLNIAPQLLHYTNYCDFLWLLL